MVNSLVCLKTSKSLVIFSVVLVCCPCIPGVEMLEVRISLASPLLALRRRVGSRAMNHINPMSLSLSLNPSSRKRTRADLSHSDDDGTHTDSDTEHKKGLSKKLPPSANFPRFIVMKPTYSEQSLTKLSPFAVEKSILGRYGTVKQVKKVEGWISPY